MRQLIELRDSGERQPSRRKRFRRANREFVKVSECLSVDQWTWTHKVEEFDG